MCKLKNSLDAAYTAPGALIARQACQHRAPLPISLICLSLFSKNSPAAYYMVKFRNLVEILK